MSKNFGKTKLTPDGRYAKQYDSTQEAEREAALCGCGRDCCDDTEHWIDKTTKEHYVEYVNNGAKVLELYSAYAARGFQPA